MDRKVASALLPMGILAIGGWMVWIGVVGPHLRDAEVRKPLPPLDAAVPAQAQAQPAEESATAEPAPVQPTPALEEVLTIRGFDLDRALALVETSPLSAEQKASARAALEGARHNPAVLETVMSEIRAALAP
jgi:hypothetical protein